jgi:5-methylthioribose kinase
MRRLHGDHIFALPFRPNDFSLSEVVRRRAREIWDDTSLRSIADSAYERYLESHIALVHADVQSSNILLTANGPTLLDAEIAHVGDPAFDVGTLIAHVLLAGIAAGHRDQARDSVRAVWRAYRNEARCAFEDVARYAGIEMLRRTIGAARVAAVASGDTALKVLDYACDLIHDPPEDCLDQTT